MIKKSKIINNKPKTVPVKSYNKSHQGTNDKAIPVDSYHRSKPTKK